MQGFFALLFFGLGFACLHSLAYQLRIRAWPVTNGKLLEADTRIIGGHDARRPSETDYINSVAYAYSVDGESYVGDRFSPWVVVASHNLKRLLEKQLDDVETGGNVPVRYNPKKPAKSFLKKPGLAGLLVTSVFALFCFYTPVLVFK